MNRLDHAFYARLLIEACGGPTTAADRCRVNKSQLGDYQSPHGESFMPSDVLADLEAYCGQPLYSRALFEARPEVMDAKALTDEVCEAVEVTADLQREVRLALKAGGVVTPLERARLRRRHAEAMTEMRHVGVLLGEGAA